MWYNNSMDITIIEQTPEQVAVGDPIQYEFKVPQTFKDDFGNEMTQYRKDIHTRAQLESEKESLIANKALIDKEIEVVDNKLAMIDAL